MSLKNKNVLLTGMSSLVGSHMAKHLLTYPGRLATDFILKFEQGNLV